MKKLITNPDICITGMGLITSVGHDVKTACASIRAGLKRPRQLDNFHVHSKNGFEDCEDGLVTGFPVLDGGLDDAKSRIKSLSESVFLELQDYAGIDRQLAEETPLYVSLSENGREKLDQDDFYEFVSGNRETFPFNVESITTYTLGHAGMVFALCNAVEAVQEGKFERAVIAGVDTLVGFEDLVRFNRQGRLKTELNSNGFMPGEAASAILIEKKTSAVKRNSNIGAVLKMISTGYENDHILSRKPATGKGLADSITAMIASAEEKSINTSVILSDINGEIYRFEEWGMVQPRIVNQLSGDKKFICPARSIGDTGAASAGISICVAVRAMARGYLGSGDALIVSSSDSGKRGAIYLAPYNGDKESSRRQAG